MCNDKPIVIVIIIVRSRRSSGEGRSIRRSVNVPGSAEKIAVYRWKSNNNYKIDSTPPQ